MQLQLQQFEVGDTVQLTATAVFELNKNASDVLTAMLTAGRTGGEVLSVSDDQITVDIGLEAPLVIEGTGNTRDMSLQIVKKVEKPEETKAPAPVPVVAPATQPVDAFIPAMAQQFNPAMIPQLLGFGVGHPEGAVPLMRTVRNAAGELLHQSYPQQEQVLPPQIRLAQWVMNQFIGLKQYGIVQDLNRTPDADARHDDQSNYGEKKNVRAVAIELSSTEESLYNTALKKIGHWISGDKPATTVAVHPEMETSDEIEIPPSCGEIIPGPCPNDQ